MVHFVPSLTIVMNSLQGYFYFFIAVHICTLSNFCRDDTVYLISPMDALTWLNIELPPFMKRDGQLLLQV